jgi:AcrR family transcriptional regulator
VNVDGGAFVAKQATADKRQRRERGSINPDDIIKGAFELAEEVGIDNLSMPLLGRHLGVGVTSIYWYFRKKDDLLNAMTDRALRTYVFATPYIAADDWRETLHNHAWTMRKTFMGNPILCDLILIRSALSPKAAQLGVLEVEKSIASLVEAGLSAEDAFETYSAVSVHVRGSVVLERLYEKNLASADGASAQLDDRMSIDPENTPLLAKATADGLHRIATTDDANFEYALNCILDHAERLIAAGPKKKAASKTTKSAGRARKAVAAN